MFLRVVRWFTAAGIVVSLVGCGSGSSSSATNAKTVQETSKMAGESFTGSIISVKPSPAPKLGTSAVQKLKALGSTVPSPLSVGPLPVYTLAIDRLYRVQLGREPDVGGQTFWMLQLINGSMSIQQIEAAFRNSPEYLGRGGAGAEMVTALYQTDLSRQPDPGGLANATSLVNQSLNNVSLVARILLGSPEFANLGVVSQLPAERLYEEKLGRSGDPGGLVFWTDELALGSLNSIQVEGYFRASAEYANRGGQTAETVTALYHAILGRQPDAPGLAAWVSELNSGNMTLPEVAFFFMISPEHLAQASQ